LRDEEKAGAVPQWNSGFGKWFGFGPGGIALAASRLLVVTPGPVSRYGGESYPD